MTAFPRKQPPVDFKTQYSLSFTAQEDEIVVDFFCGGGGVASTGLEMGLGRPVAVAKNHSAKAILSPRRTDFALVTVTIQGIRYVVVDIGLRMLQPRELYRAQSFPDSYQIEFGHDGKPFTKSEQVHMCGNSVSPPHMAAIARADVPWRAAVATPRRTAAA